MGIADLLRPRDGRDLRFGPDLDAARAANHAIPICDEPHAILLPLSGSSGLSFLPGMKLHPGKRYRLEFRKQFAKLAAEANIGSG
jgi:hypothetical protein